MRLEYQQLQYALVERTVQIQRVLEDSPLLKRRQRQIHREDHPFLPVYRKAFELTTIAVATDNVDILRSCVGTAFRQCDPV